MAQRGIGMQGRDVMDQLAGGPPKESGEEEFMRPDRAVPPGGIGSQILEEQELDSEIIISAGAALDEAVSVLTGNMSKTDAANIFSSVRDRILRGSGGGVDEQE